MTQGNSIVFSDIGQSQLEIAVDSLSPPKRGEGWGEGI